MNDEEEKVALIYNIKLPYLFQKKLKDGLGQEIGDIFEEALIETVGDAKDVNIRNQWAVGVSLQI